MNAGSLVPLRSISRSSGGTSRCACALPPPRRVRRGAGPSMTEFSVAFASEVHAGAGAPNSTRVKVVCTPVVSELPVVARKDHK